MTGLVAAAVTDPDIREVSIVHIPRRTAALLVSMAILVAGCGSAGSSANPVAATTTPAYFDVSWTDHYAGIAEPFDITARSVAVDYRANGSCSLGFRLVPQSSAGSSVPTPTASVSGGDVAGTWHLTVTPGRYHLEGGGDGCDWSVTIRPA